MKKQTVKYILQMPVEMKDRLDKEARRCGIATCAVVRSAILSYFELPDRERAMTKLNELLNRLM